MAFSPVDSSSAVVIRNYSAGGMVQIMTGLTSATPLAGTPVNLPTGTRPYSVAVSPDGKLAILGTNSGLLLYKGIDTSTPTLVGTTLLGLVPTLGITLDGKYVVAWNVYNKSLTVIPFTAVGLIVAPSNDQLVIH